MRTLRIVNDTRQRELGSEVWLADRWWPRLRGLLGRGPLEPGRGLVLEPCKAVHMFGMKFSIDVAFVDREGVVVALYPGLEPGARTPWHKPAEKAIELPVGTIEATGTEIGDVLKCQPVEEAA